MGPELTPILVRRGEGERGFSPERKSLLRIFSTFFISRVLNMAARA
jgi:hypothetical protein